MLEQKINDQSKFILAMHSSDDYFGFAYKELNVAYKKEDFFIKELKQDLSNNLISDLASFLNDKSIKQIERIAISLGPANFNASRQIVVCSKALSQQINCSLDSYSSFQLIASRIAMKDKLMRTNESFWVIKKLKKRGFIAGKYGICNESTLDINELIKPKLFKHLPEIKKQYGANYDILGDLKELLNLSSRNYDNSIINKWQEVFPIYPMSAIN